MAKETCKQLESGGRQRILISKADAELREIAARVPTAMRGVWIDDADRVQVWLARAARF